MKVEMNNEKIKNLKLQDLKNSFWIKLILKNNV